MTEYECGHECIAVFLVNDPLAFAAYLQWKDSVGWNGTKEKCFDCYCNELNKITPKGG